MTDTNSKLSNELILSIAGSEGMFSKEYNRNAGDACIRFARAIERAVTPHAPQGDANPFNGPLADRIYKAITDIIMEDRDGVASGAGEWLPTVEAVNALPEGIRKYVQQLEAEVARAATQHVSAPTLTAEQIAAGAAVQGDDGKPVGRNTAIMVFDAMGGVSAPSAHEADVDLSKCPGCGGDADNGHDRCVPPSPYYCTQCCADDSIGDLEPVEGDLLPPVGSKVLIHLGRQDAWVEHTVSGYYVWGALSHQVREGEKNAHRVFVRVKDANGYDNARLLSEVRMVAAMSASPATPEQDTK